METVEKSVDLFCSTAVDSVRFDRAVLGDLNRHPFGVRQLAATFEAPIN